MSQADYSLDFRPGVRVAGGKHDAAAIAAALKAIEQKHGALRPDDVVTEARKASHPLHRYFDWNDAEAAASWRVEQARALIASVRVRLSEAPSREPVRAFVAVPAPSRDPNYLSTEAAFADPAMRALVLDRALRELESFQRRYAELDELAAVFTAAKRVRTRAAKAA